MGSDKDRIHRQMRGGSMTALPPDRNIDLIRARHYHSPPEAQLAHLKPRMYMQPEDGLRLRIVQHAFPDHQTGAARILLLTRLKDQLHRSLPFIAQLLQDPRRPQ